jgi:UDP:flavonoid glycosyltransferase YjiC (YdhE family)
MLSDVVLVTRGSKGDLYPFLQIGKTFKEKGHRVILITDHFYQEYASDHGFDFVSLDDQASKSLNGMPEFYGSLPALLKLYEERIIPRIKQELKLIESVISVKKKVILVAHSNYYLSSLMAMEKFNVPLYLCVLSPSFVHSFSLFEGIAKSLSSELNAIRVDVDLGPINDWKRWLSSYTRGIAFWPEWFSDGTCNSVFSFGHVGFLPTFATESGQSVNSALNFFPGRSKRVLFTHGTSLPFDERYFRLGLETCQELGIVLLLTTPFRHLLPDALPEGVVWADFLPFDKLLPFVDLTIHHGGVGTVRESIMHGVPQLVIGQGFDRQHNGRIVSHLGVGDWIPPKLLSKEILLKKIKDIFTDDKTKSTCERYAALLKDQMPFDTLYASIFAEEAA